MTAAFQRLPRAQRELLLEQFGEWWEVWPRKVGKEDALKAWKALAGQGILPHAPKLIEITARQVESRHLKPDDRYRYAPYPATWLRGKRWEDKIEDRRPGSPFAVKPADFDAGHGRSSPDPWSCDCEKCAFYAKTLEEDLGSDARARYLSGAAYR